VNVGSFVWLTSIGVRVKTDAAMTSEEFRLGADEEEDGDTVGKEVR